MWASHLALLVIGMATGGWWSRRKAIARAVAHARAEAHAEARATAGHMIVVGSLDDARALAASAGGRTDYDHVLDYDHGTAGHLDDPTTGHRFRRYDQRTGAGLGSRGPAVSGPDRGRALDPGWSGDELRALGVDDDAR